MTNDTPAPIRLVIVDDSEVVRMGLRALIGADPSMEIVGDAHNVASAVETCRRVKPQVVLLDIRLPDGTGFDACRSILKHLPETRVLVLTSVADDSLVDQAIRCGAHGYLLKEVDARALSQAIRDVAAGKSILDPAVTSRVMRMVKSGSNNDVQALASLSPQEQRVLALIAEGKTNKEVAMALNLSEKTVKNYLANMFDKLEVTRRAQAAAMFAKNKAVLAGTPGGA
ncbi:MAG TPA: response regulator transcription factor [Opitutaceae bacterium]|nr:response regulator transcription factor [Opitutaceae bacterium]HOR24834.1 response regulator transcription factor [Opitutaceae bacterium]HPK49369.1 response regulator transcription factor [Opitutaceae bacterium]